MKKASMFRRTKVTGIGPPASLSRHCRIVTEISAPYLEIMIRKAAPGSGLILWMEKVSGMRM